MPRKIKLRHNPDTPLKSIRNQLRNILLGINFERTVIVLICTSADEFAVIKSPVKREGLGIDGVEVEGVELCIGHSVDDFFELRDAEEVAGDVD